MVLEQSLRQSCWILLTHSTLCEPSRKHFICLASEDAPASGKEWRPPYNDTVVVLLLRFDQAAEITDMRLSLSTACSNRCESRCHKSIVRMSDYLIDFENLVCGAPFPHRLHSSLGEYGDADLLLLQRATPSRSQGKSNFAVENEVLNSAAASAGAGLLIIDCQSIL